jgi:uncharacterized damage-inducible protein DinB
MISAITEPHRLADQIHRAFEGNTWHGDSILELLKDVNAATAAARPIPNAHSIWELVLHITAWDDAVRRRAGGTTLTLSDEENFPPVKDTSETAWQKALDHMTQKHKELVDAVKAFPESRLSERVAGKTNDYYTFYYMFSGIVQHELYHAGQIALLKKFK